MATAITAQASSFEQVIRLKLPWAAYDALVESLEDNGHVRLTYDGEILEIVSPSPLHEIISRVVAGLLSTRLAAVAARTRATARRCDLTNALLVSGKRRSRRTSAGRVASYECRTRRVVRSPRQCGFNISRAAFQPAAPITPPPGCAAEPQRKRFLTGVL